MVRIGIGSDHFGFGLKGKLLSHLLDTGRDAHDFGTFTGEPVDYPEIAVKVAEAVRAGVIERGILVCGTGLGMAIAANKVRGILAAPVTDVYTARLARERNNTHIITLGANVVGAGLATDIVDAWLSAEFRHGDSERKVGQILALDERYRSRDLPVLLLEG